jgi:RsmE family RNA methyltransferase
MLLLEDRDRVSGALFRLTGRRARHVREVLGAAVGRELRVGLLEGPLGSGRVVAASEGAVDLECALEGEPPPRASVDLVLAVPRPRSLVKLLPEVAALGVDRLVLLRSWRVQRPYLTARALEPAVYRPLLHEGLMQARATREPRVSVEPLFRPFVEDRLPALVAGARGLVAHPGATRDLASVRLAAGERVVLAIGPEGGFIPWEVEALEKAGLAPVTMGPRTLRVETACVALLAGVDLLRRI